MGHGGRRENSGRKAGSANLKTREIADKRAADGKLTPVEVMLDNMDFYHHRADEVLERLLTEIPQAGEAIAASSEDPAIAQAGADTARQAALDTLRSILRLREMAGEAAVQAAPFMNVRLAPMVVKPDDGGEDHVPLAERLKAYAQAEAIEASQGKVVALGGKK